MRLDLQPLTPALAQIVTLLMVIDISREGKDSRNTLHWLEVISTISHARCVVA